MISPPIRRTSCWLIARPRPVPPARRERSATCSKGWNSRSICSRAMPMPVSETVKRSIRLLGPWATTSTDSPIRPWSVNLTALDSRFSSTWRSRWPSARTRVGSCASRWTSKARPFSAARGRIDSLQISSSARRSSGLSCRVSLPASMLATSSRSVISTSRCSPDSRIRRMRCCCASLSEASICSSCAKPRMALSGVRNSWLIVARKRLLAWFAASARCLAWDSSTVRSVTSSSR